MKAIYNVGLRDALYPGEEAYFKANPNVAGMAAEDDNIIINPYSSLTDTEKQAVMMNEAARVLMRRGDVPRPNFSLTPKQMEKFSTYSKNMDDIRQTFAARMLSNDPSAIEPTSEQKAFVEQLRKFMGAAFQGASGERITSTLPAGFSKMKAITVQSESGGNPNAVSPKGARGLMQVMPGTSRDPGFGVAPSKGTASDDVRLGGDYLSAMMERYGNDPAKAWAAYNLGPGKLDKTLAKHGSSWLSKVPAETRNYVMRNMRALRN